MSARTRSARSRRSTGHACLINRITMRCSAWIRIRPSYSSATTAYAVNTPRSTSGVRDSAISTICGVASTLGHSSSIPPYRATSVCGRAEVGLGSGGGREPWFDDECRHRTRHLRIGRWPVHLECQGERCNAQSPIIAANRKDRCEHRIWDVERESDDRQGSSIAGADRPDRPHPSRDARSTPPFVLAEGLPSRLHGTCTTHRIRLIEVSGRRVPDDSDYSRETLPIQPVDATVSASVTAGVRYPSVLRGRVLSRRAIASS